MAMYSFSLESCTALACRSKAGLDDLWLIVTVTVGQQPAAWASSPIGFGVQAGQGIAGPWSAGPYELADGDTAVAAYTLVNLRGSVPEDQQKLTTGLAADLAAARARFPADGVEAAVRSVFGPAGELVRAPGVDVGPADCQGLVGVCISRFQGLNSPRGDEVQTVQDVTLSATAPATCGTTPRYTAAFSVRVGPNPFAATASVALLSPDYLTIEVFAVGLDGNLWHKVRQPSAAFANWSVVGSVSLSSRAPIAALVEPSGTKRIFATGVDGEIYQLQSDAAGGWQPWMLLIKPGQFSHRTALSAVTGQNGTILMAWDVDGIAREIALDGSMSSRTIGGPSFAPDAPLLAISATSAIAIDEQGSTYSTSRQFVSMSAPGASASASTDWQNWQKVGVPAGAGTGPRRLCATLGLGVFQVDGEGNILWLLSAAEGTWQIVPGLQTQPGGWVSGVDTGNDLRIFSLDPETGAIRQAVKASTAAPAAWSAWESVPLGPEIQRGTAVSAICTGDAHIELFVVDVHGQVRRLGWRPATGWGSWATI